MFCFFFFFELVEIGSTIDTLVKTMKSLFFFCLFYFFCYSSNIAIYFMVRAQQILQRIIRQIFSLVSSVLVSFFISLSSNPLLCKSFLQLWFILISLLIFILYLCVSPLWLSIKNKIRKNLQKFVNISFYYHWFFPLYVFI